MEQRRGLPAFHQADWREMEEEIVEIRQRWFGAQVERLPIGILLREREGVLLLWEQAERAQVERWLNWARQQRAYIVQTTMSSPPELAVHLSRMGFRRVQEQGTYLFAGLPATTGPEPDAPARARNRSLLGWLRPRRPAAQVEIQEITAAHLPVWNRVCWHAFAPRLMSEASSLAEKQRAFANLQDSSHWYLAWVEGKPAGTLILYEGTRAGQILAVGTLPAARRRGVAGTLVRHAIEVHAAHGSMPLFLDTQPGSAAERLYLSLGFSPAYLRQTYAPLQLP